MAGPPFIMDTGSPASSDIISTFPVNEQANRALIEEWLTFLSDPTTGIIKLTALDLSTVIRTNAMGTITTASSGWAGRLLNLRSATPGISLQDSTGAAISSLIAVDANVLTIYSTTLNDGTDLVARLTLNLSTGAVQINGNVTVNGTMTVTG